MKILPPDVILAYICTRRMRRHEQLLHRVWCYSVIARFTAGSSPTKITALSFYRNLYLPKFNANTASFWRFAHASFLFLNAHAARQSTMARYNTAPQRARRYFRDSRWKQRGWAQRALIFHFGDRVDIALHISRYAYASDVMAGFLLDDIGRRARHLLFLE